MFDYDVDMGGEFGAMEIDFMNEGGLVLPMGVRQAPLDLSEPSSVDVDDGGLVLPMGVPQAPLDLSASSSFLDVVATNLPLSERFKYISATVLADPARQAGRVHPGGKIMQRLGEKYAKTINMVLRKASLAREEDNEADLNDELKTKKTLSRRVDAKNDKSGHQVAPETRRVPFKRLGKRTPFKAAANKFVKTEEGRFLKIECVHPDIATVSCPKIDRSTPVRASVVQPERTVLPIYENRQIEFLKPTRFPANPRTYHKTSNSNSVRKFGGYESTEMPKSREELDLELDIYMANAKGKSQQSPMSTNNED